MRIGVLGAGAFGTALAIVLARAGREVTLWGRDAAALADMQATRRNARHLPQAKLPDGLAISVGLPSADIYLLAVPTRALGDLAAMTKGPGVLVACCKGIDRDTGLGQSALMARARPDALTAVLSGPGFAEDLALGLPTAMTLAARDDTALEALQRALSTPELRLYRSGDVTGVELGGAIKNVIALAAGVVLGAGLGESARAALITRGYAEMTRFALARGAEAQTLAGLSGLGDLILTATSTKSRNFAHGLQVGRGGALTSTATVEGIGTTAALAQLARDLAIDMPITEALAQVLGGQITVAEAVAALMGRPLKAEGG